MSVYKALTKQQFTSGEYALVPIRAEDRYAIMQWRNEQIYHLRQAEPLTKEKQDWYFENVVVKLFDQEQPNQLLFSFLKNGECIGYGGLVHMNWIDKNAEISFIMKTELEADGFEKLWSEYLSLIEWVGFKELNLHKLFTYAFDLRPHLYSVLEDKRFKLEATLKEHCYFNGSYKSVLIHAKFNKALSLRMATENDVNLTYKWANDKAIRKFAFSKQFISKEDHIRWFLKKINDPNCLYYIALLENEVVGSFRVDIENNEAVISFLLDASHHGKRLGKKLLSEGVAAVHGVNPEVKIVGFVMKQNIASAKLFKRVGFSETEVDSETLKYIMEK